MDSDAKTDKSSSRSRAKQRIVAPVAGQLKKASWIAIAQGALWPVQAAVIAYLVSQWADGNSDLETGMLCALAFLVLAAVRAGLDYVAGSLLFRAADITIERERQRLLRREALALGNVGSGAVAALVVQKLPLIQHWITRYYVAMAKVSVLPFLFLALAFWHSWAAGIVLLVAGPLIPVFMALVGMAAEQASRDQLDEISSLNDMLIDRLRAVLDIRLLGASERSATVFNEKALNLKDRTMAVLRIAFLSSTVLELFSALGVALIAVYVGFSLLGELEFGTWGAPLSLQQGIFLLLLAPEYFQPLRDLAAAWHDRAAGLAVVDELEELDALEREHILGVGSVEKPLSGELSLDLKAGAILRGDKRLDLPDLQIAKGDALALVGPSGAGKTTTLAALLGLAELDHGTITVCGQPLTAENADAWRARIATVFQKTHFPAATLGTFLDPLQSGGDIDQALELANAKDVVARLPDGLQTRLGETGGGVSGGEARRLMIARALMMQRELLVMDEPTSDLDPENADMIIDTLVRLKHEGRTLVVATHDMKLAEAMDRVVEVLA
ncbi:MAG: ATP-binding cassette domain-containing protein [Rhodobacteraceae bacterium]|nr:ATP-binding cassette domain-containing protein [Paracoccaceae bacterium]